MGTNVGVNSDFYAKACLISNKNTISWKIYAQISPSLHIPKVTIIKN
jgi:hypothetical protein